MNITYGVENILCKYHLQAGKYKKKFVFMARALMCKIQIDCNGKINT